ncbi:MAG: hypothetical protein KJ067_18735 [Vicinamibacteria bacterium]|nr:hypothetical protein [Vicinamibacteria bacterium]
MRALALELADTGLVARGGGALADRRLPAPSPGLAVIDGARLLVGREALRVERLRPLHAHDRFWDRLDTAPAGAPFPDHLRNADLAHAHLRAMVAELRLAEPAATTFAVPGWYSEAQLGLLLAVARAAGLPACGLVDAAVAAAAATPREGAALHVDVSLHRTVLTSLQIDSAVERGGLDVASAGGLAGLREAIARGVAAAFVRETRFDPLHDAASEQALHDHLDSWLAALRDRDETSATLDAGGRRHAVRLVRARVEEWAGPLRDDLVRRSRALAPAGASLLLSPRAAAVPGLAARLAALPGLSVVELPEEAAISGALRLGAEGGASHGALPFVTRMETGGGDAQGATARIRVSGDGAPQG